MYIQWKLQLFCCIVGEIILALISCQLIFICILFVPLFYSLKTVNKIFSCLIFFQRHEEMLTSHFEV